MPETQGDPESTQQVRIHIDEMRHSSPNPTTGKALYALGKVSEGHELYREVAGDREDQPIQNGDEKVVLTEDEHFHSESRHKEYTIIVNARQKVVPSRKVSFAEIVALAFENVPVGENIIFTVTYREAEGNKQGTLVAGETVDVKNGTIFDVTSTDKS